MQQNDSLADGYPTCTPSAPMVTVHGCVVSSRKLCGKSFRIVLGLPSDPGGRNCLAAGETVMLPYPRLPLAGVSTRMERGCQCNDRTLADGSRAA